MAKKPATKTVENRHYDVVLAPYITEKSTMVSEYNAVVFKVAGTASKPQIKEAIEAIRREQPGLVLADIHLADGSSGIDAVNEILEQCSPPVIFITAYPERLLTGERPEPTFLISKPYDPAAVKAMVSQVLFFEASAARRKVA